MTIALDHGPFLTVVNNNTVVKVMWVVKKNKNKNKKIAWFIHHFPTIEAAVNKFLINRGFTAKYRRRKELNGRSKYIAPIIQQVQ